MIVLLQSVKKTEEQVMAAIFKNRTHVVVQDAIVLLVISRKLGSVVAINAILGGYPDDILMVMLDVSDQAAGKLRIGRKQPGSLPFNEEGRRE